MKKIFAAITLALTAITRLSVNEVPLVVTFTSISLLKVVSEYLFQFKSFFILFFSTNLFDFKKD